MLIPTESKDRQQSLLDALPDLDAVVLGLPEHVYWASAHRTGWLSAGAVVIHRNGPTILVTADRPATSEAVDKVVSFEGNWSGTQRQEQPAVAAELAIKELAGKRVGVDTSAVGSRVAMSLGKIEFVDEVVWQCRRRKRPDEVAIIRRAAAAAAAMYRTAREIIRPGLTDLEMYGRLFTAAVEEAGEPLSAYLGNDYACGVPGGPARSGHATAGQLWVLDLGPAVRGYFSDSCRTFAVDRKPTVRQLEVQSALCEIFPMIERTARPGVRCRDLYESADAMLQKSLGRGLPHHLGHGVGLQPHEYPHLSPKWDDTLVEGDVFTIEPGYYDNDVNTGMRLENQYLVTATGIENLIDFPMDLT